MTEVHGTYCFCCGAHILYLESVILEETDCPKCGCKLGQVSDSVVPTELIMRSSEIDYNRIKHLAHGAARTVYIVVWNRDHYPVDPVYIAKKLGAQVVVARLPNQVYGALMKEKGSDPIIYLEETDSEQRQRFTCAHELGHMYSKIGDDEYETIDLRDEWLSTSGSNAEEIFANQFAANLLMPEGEIRAQVHQSKAKLLSHFGVSGEAMKWRFKNLDISHPEFMGMVADVGLN